MPIRLTPKPRVQSHNEAEFAHTGANMSPLRPAKVRRASLSGWKCPDVKSFGVNRIGMDEIIEPLQLRLHRRLAAPHRRGVFALETRHGLWAAQMPIKPKGVSKKKCTFGTPAFQHFTEAEPAQGAVLRRQG
jgi:hypothetical protein